MSADIQYVKPLVFQQLQILTKGSKNSTTIKQKSKTKVQPYEIKPRLSNQS